MDMSVESVSTSGIMQQLQDMQKQMKLLADNSSVQEDLPAVYDPNAGKYDVAGQVSRVEQPDEGTPRPTAENSVSEFETLLREAFENVNVLQNTAGEMSTKFDLGDRTYSLAEVMIAAQKSEVSFQATLQIRNKLVDAYQQVYTMSI